MIIQDVVALPANGNVKAAHDMRSPMVIKPKPEQV